MPDKVVTRRMFARGIPALAGGTALSSLFHNLNAQSSADERANRLLARPGAAGASMSPGLHQLGLREERDALLYIPESSAKQESAPLVVSLHGASRNADRGIELLRTLSDEHGFLLLAPASQGRTWDLIQGVGGPDLAFINHSLARTFESRKIDPARIAMAGFSDGATCSLSLGLAKRRLVQRGFWFLARLCGGDGARWQASCVHLSRNNRSGASDRTVQPPHRAGIETPGLPRDLSGVRRQTHPPPGSRFGSRALVPASPGVIFLYSGSRCLLSSGTFARAPSFRLYLRSLAGAGFGGFLCGPAFLERVGDAFSAGRRQASFPPRL
jgi:predicted esterase